MVESGELLRGASLSPPAALAAYRASPPAPPLLLAHPYLYPALPCFGGPLYPLPGLLRGRPPPPPSPPPRAANPFSMDVILGRRPAAEPNGAAPAPGLGRLQLHAELFGESSGQSCHVSHLDRTVM